MKWQAAAPSNIALIKYMGKTDGGNISTNASLSYTLGNLLTFIELEPTKDSTDKWEALNKEGCERIHISESGQARFLKHLGFLKKEFNFNGNFIVRSANNFPSDCGLASSASSFAALTMAAYKAVKDLKKADLKDYSLEALADLSRQGSGSSCRSFFAPWSLWDDNGARKVDLPFEKLHHQVVVVNDKIKQVSSSEAHKRIRTSSLSTTRTDRAQERLEKLMINMKAQDWKTSYEIIWNEFWDMHALFETSQPPFGYMSRGSLHVLDSVKSIWQNQNDGPWVTMDAGPNVHLLYRPDQKYLAQNIAQDLSAHFQVITNYV